MPRGALIRIALGFALSGFIVPGLRAEEKPATPPAAPAAEPQGSGKILYEFWSGIEGTALTDLTGNANYPNTPTMAQQLDVFDAPVDRDDSFGAKISGYIHPPTTGEYTFFFASDDQGELWLSTDDNPDNKQKIANVPEWTNSKEWDKFPEQKSKAIKLEAGKKYYIEGLMKEGGGGDNLSAGWVLPGGAEEKPIPGKRLSPFVKVPLPPDAAGGSGKILYEYYSGITGTSLTDLSMNENFPAKPTGTQQLEVFDAPVDRDDNFGARIRGFVHAPQTGMYTFWFCSDDQGELRLSTDEDPKNAVVIANVTEWAGTHEWEKTPDQKSKQIKLEAGKKYYIEARMKEGEGGDNLSVGWTSPGGKMERPIPGKWLSPPPEEKKPDEKNPEEKKP